MYELLLKLCVIIKLNLNQQSKYFFHVLILQYYGEVNKYKKALLKLYKYFRKKNILNIKQ